MTLTSIPSPPMSTLSLGPLTLHLYGLVIGIGVLVALVWATRRYKARGGDENLVFDAALFAVPAGIIGGRLYHVVTSPEYYFGEGSNPIDALKIWNGGLGIWGAIALGALACWWVVRRRGQRLGPFADALAPAVAAAQAIGRLGNWFNQELFGAPTTLAWGLEIDAAHLPAGHSAGTLFHPTFLYELVWNLALAGVLVALERRKDWRAGQIWWLYVAGYCAGRIWIEMLRIDQANLIFGVRVNVWTSLLIGLFAAVMAWRTGRVGGPRAVAPAEIAASDTTEAIEADQSQVNG